ncbi:MAG: hypothetical protein ACREJC_21095 [Tepidisphaeraceae bacterium]
MAKAKCHVKFITGRGGPAAILYDQHGRALNAMNYPKGHRFTAKAKTASRRRLMTGCQELADNLDRTGKSGYPLGGAKRRRR